MTQLKPSDLPLKYDFRRFKRICRAELKKLGVAEIRFKVSACTGALLVIFDFDKLGKNRNRVFKRFFELIDADDVPAAPMPASYYRCHVG